MAVASSWTSRLGFILASAGSAVRLGSNLEISVR